MFGDAAQIARDVWHARELLYQLTLRDVRLRYKQAVMGFAWAFFMPVLTVLSGIVVKQAIAFLGGTGVETKNIAYVAVKALPWAFFVGALNFATISLTMNIGLVTKIYFPREVLPLAATLVQAVDSMVGGLALLCVLPMIGIAPSWAWLWLPVLAILLLSFTVACALSFSCANLFFRDVKYITQIVLTFGIFFSPVLYEPGDFGPQGARWMMLNPLAPILEGLRLCVVEGHNLLLPLMTQAARVPATMAWEPWYLVYSAAWSFGGLLASGLLFHRLQFLFAEYI